MEDNYIISDQISSDIIENICQHLTKSTRVYYYKVKENIDPNQFRFHSGISNVEIFDSIREIKRRKIPLCQCKTSPHILNCPIRYQYGIKFAIPYSYSKIIGGRTF